MSLLPFKSFYLNSKSSARLIRYDIITIDADNYTVKVFDDQQAGVSPPHQIVLLDEIQLKRSDYEAKYEIGKRGAIKLYMPPTFESYVNSEVQSHRDKLN